MTLRTPGRKTLRTLIQLTAAGGFAGAFAVGGLGLSPWRTYLITSAGTLAVVWSQNRLEVAEAIPTILPTTPVPGREDEPLPLVRPTRLAE